ncbi:MAG TPA: FHA domain-containing protein [Candidatus Acidoferrales bacterium]|nr:FHA domain-containing protein [Candidatus Acidoferrales bacterium]
MPRIVIHHADRHSQVLELTGDRPLSIGRGKSSDLVLDDPDVSRLHAVVRVNPDSRWEIIDRSNTNGIKINGKPTKEALLASNDEISIGMFRLRFEDSAERKIMSYGTSSLPGGVAKLVGESSYSSSFMSVEPVGVLVAMDAKAPDHSRLQSLEEENRLLKVLYRVNQALSQIERVDELTHRILDLVLEIAGAERAYGMLLDENSSIKIDWAKGDYSFKPAVIRYKADAARESTAPQLIISRTIIRQVMQSGMPLLVTDGQADSRFAANSSVVNAGIQSAMCAPLGMANRIRGLLYVDNLSKRGMFTVEHLNVFAVVAVQAGLAVDRLQGYTQPAEITQ